ncbi:pyrimidine utilization protein A [Rhodococcus sp. NPDC059968]|uniref:pyrimidine utilization protein A n=1 Tax=Rhodococcus sp. NPDC059968 TaxID=3347017 RepID=UPI00366D6843
MTKIGVFIPINNNGWLLSSTSPQYMPTFELNKEIARRAEHYDLDFLLSMIKWRGYGGETEYWDYGLESFTLMAGLAAVTEKIDLYASIAVLTMPPAVVARMAVTIDSIAPGRFGVNIVSGWAKAEYDQMGIWPGDEYFGYRYDYSSEYMQIMRELWETGHSNFKGEHFQMDDCHLLPRPSQPIKVVSAGQSDRGMKFVADYCDYGFVVDNGVNVPKDIAPTVERLNAAKAEVSNEIGCYVLQLVIAAETDEEAMKKWETYNQGADAEAMAAMGLISAGDPTVSSGVTTSSTINNALKAKVAVPHVICGSYETVARSLDDVAEIPGVSGVMLIFDDYLVGIEQFGQYIQPLMKSRSEIGESLSATGS